MGRRRERSGVWLIAECRADDVAAAVEVENRWLVTRARSHDQRRDAAGGHRARDGPGGGSELGVERLERRATLDQVRVAGEHAAHRLERPRNPADQLATHRQCGPDCLVDVAKQLTRAIEQGFPGERQLDAVGGATQQLAADELLEASNLPAQGRLGDVEPLRCAPEVEFLGHRHERAQVSQLDAVRCLGEREDAGGLIHATSIARVPTVGDADRAMRSCTIGLSLYTRVVQVSPAMIDADMTLRFGRVRVPTVVHWPRVETVSLAFVLSDELSPTDPWVEGFVVVGLAGRHPSSVELAALQWMSDHACELGGRPDRMLVAGGARAARLALASRDSVGRHLGVSFWFTAWGSEQPMPSEVGGAPPATVVCGAGPDGGRRYAERLRAAGVEVHEVRDEVRDEVSDDGRR